MIAPARVVGSLRRRHPACSSAGAGQQLRALLRLRLPRSQGSSARDGLSCCICIATQCCATVSTQCSLLEFTLLQCRSSDAVNATPSNTIGAYTAEAGGPGGSVLVSVCPAGSAIDQWQITSGQFVYSLQARCTSGT